MTRTHVLWVFSFFIALLLSGCKVSAVKKDGPYLRSESVIKDEHLHIDVPSELLTCEVDIIGNIYIVDDKSSITKYNKKGDSIASFADHRLGQLSSIDASNLQKVLLYYGEQNRVVYLDQTLSSLRSIDLDLLDFWDVTAVANANDGLIWIYDEGRNQLLKIGQEGKIERESNRLKTLISSEEFEPSQIIEKNQIVYVCDPNSGIAFFDIFGHFSQFAPMTFECIFVDNDGQIIIKEQNQFSIWKPGKTPKTPIEILDKTPFFTIPGKVSVYERKK